LLGTVEAYDPERIHDVHGFDAHSARRSGTGVVNGISMSRGGSVPVGVEIDVLEAYTQKIMDETIAVIIPTVHRCLRRGWNNTDVTVSWDVSDPESGIASSTGCDTATLTAETSGTTRDLLSNYGTGLSNQSRHSQADQNQPNVSITATPSSLGTKS